MTMTTASADAAARSSRGVPFQHLGRAVGAVMRAQLALVKAEAREDTTRVLSAALLLALGVFLVVFTVAALDVALGVWLAMAVGPLAGVFLVAFIDAILAFGAFAIARVLLRRPILARTRAVARLTALELRGL